MSVNLPVVRQRRERCRQSSASRKMCTARQLSGNGNLSVSSNSPKLTDNLLSKYLKFNNI